MNKKIYDHILKLTNTAKDICLNDRHKTHGDVAENHRTIAAFWSSYLSIAIKPSQVAAMLALVKLSRVKNGMVYNEDNFVDATTLLELNQKHLNHDTDTDILTFDYTVDTKITAEAFISCEALIENAKKYNQSAEKETLRLVSHALLHCMGQNDKSEDEKLTMQRKEDACLAMFHVKK